MAESYDNHPEDKCGWLVKKGNDYYFYDEEPPGGGSWRCYHRNHDTEVTYCDTDDVTTVIRRNLHDCRDDDEDEETTN